MRRLLPTLIVIILIDTISFAQESNELVESTCDCIKDIISKNEVKKDKVAFQFSSEDCFKEVYSKSISFETSDQTEKFIEEFLSNLEISCTSYFKYQKILQDYTQIKTAIRVENRGMCRETMLVGEFEDKSGSERVIMSMRDSIQLVTYGNPNIYTKSWVKWEDNCTYSLILIESTNSLENSILKKGDKRTINIIDIKENGEIILEMQVLGGWYLLRVTKI